MIATVACEQFQSLFMRKMHRNPPQQQPMLAETAETLIQQVLAARQDEIIELDEYSKEILNGLLNELRDKINLGFQESRQDLEEAREENERMQVLLLEVNDKLVAALNENAEIKTQLHDLVNEVMAKDSEHYAQLGEFKNQAAAARQNVMQLERQRQKVELLFHHYDIKLRQLEEQKILGAHQLIREETKRRQLQAKLIEVQEQLVQLSLKYQKIQQSYDEISQSLESKQEKIKHLNKIIEESQYMSSLSPRKVDTQISEEEDKSFNSQHSHRIKKTLNQQEISLIRLSQSYLPNQKSFKSISLSIEEKQEIAEQQPLPISKERIEIVSQRKNAKKGTKLVHSHQKKPSKELLSLKKEMEKPKTNVALSKKECSNAVKSKLTSIFKDRMQYRSENDDKFEQRLEDLKERIKEKDATISKLNREVSFLKTVKTQPLTFANNAREVKSNISMRRLISQIEELQRITRELTLRKTSAEQQLAEERERCNYYKTEYRKVYENYLLKNAESIAYSQQLSELEQETSRERGTTEGKEANILEEEKDQFENLSSKFNNVARNHQHRYESSEEEEHIGKKKDYYSIQNVYLVDRSDIDLTLQNDRKPITGNLCESAQHSPAKAVLNDHSSQIQEFAFELEEIKLKEAVNQGEYTERLLLSELMQTSRRQNSLTQFQLFFSEHSEKVLELVSQGCLAASLGRERQLAINQLQTIVVLPQGKRCAIEQCYATSIFPREKKEVSIGCDLEFIDTGMQAQVNTDDYGTMYSPVFVDATTSTRIQTIQAQTNTIQKQTAEVGVGEWVSIAQFGFSTDFTYKDYGFSSQVSSEEIGVSITTITDTSSTNTAQIDTQHAQVQTLSIQQHCATQIKVEQRQSQTQTERRQMMHRNFSMFHQQVRKSNLQLNHLFTLSIDAQPIKSAKNKLCSSLLSHFIQPTITKKGLFEPKKDKQMPKLNLSFLQSSRGNGEEESIFDDDHQSDFQSFSSFTSILQTEEAQQTKESVNLQQMHSGRTRSSSQELHSQRSEKAENQKKSSKARVKNPIKESMISQNSSCSEQSVTKKASKANGAKYKQHKTAQQTPAVDSKHKARQSPQIEKQSQLFSKKELSVIKDYFYLLQSMEQVQELTLTPKQTHIEKYDFHHNMYAFKAEKGGRIDKFVVWRGKVIHFGPKSEFIELVNYAQSCKIFKGNFVSLGNCEFRIVQDRLQIHRLNKRRCFKGEMENGEWHIQQIWTFATN